MIQLITIPNGSSFFETSLDGESVKIDIYYSITIDRFLMDIENLRLKRKSVGIVLNVGIDLLESSGRLGLEAFVLVSMPEPFREGTIDNFNLGSLKLAYMDMQTYSDYVLLGGESRQKWIEQTPNDI